MEENFIINNIKEGNKQEIEKVYVQYREEFIMWVVSKNRIDVNDAKEIYQQSFLIFYENIVNGKLKKLKSSLKTYLFAICKNKVFEFNRDKKRKRMIDINKITEDNNYSDETERRDHLLNISEKSLSILGGPCKTLLESFYYHKKNMQEITIEMGYKNENTTKNQKYKCLNRLREIFKKEVKKDKSFIYA